MKLQIIKYDDKFAVRRKYFHFWKLFGRDPITKDEWFQWSSEDYKIQYCLLNTIEEAEALCEKIQKFKAEKKYKLPFPKHVKYLP